MILNVSYMRVEQKVHERGFLCVSLWVCNEHIFFRCSSSSDVVLLTCFNTTHI